MRKAAKSSIMALVMMSLANPFVHASEAGEADDYPCGTIADYKIGGTELHGADVQYATYVHVYHHGRNNAHSASRFGYTNLSGYHGMGAC